MAERQWTNAQREAITCGSPDILVSAAAGSGKTAVLTKRLIDKLTDKTHPADIARMLIVTFTKAAAGELKERIADALRVAMAEDPSDKRLQRQYVLLGKAKIATIHGFCLDLIKQNFETLGLSPSVRVMDAAQSALLMEQVADVVIDSYYDALPGYTDIEDFVSFADNFIGLEDKGLSQILISLYNKVCSFPRGVHFFEDSAIELQKAETDGLFATVWGELILSHMVSAFRYYKEVLKTACDYFDTEEYRDKYRPAFLHAYGSADALLSAAKNKKIDTLRELLFSYTTVSLKPLKKELQTDECLFYRDQRKSLSDTINEFAQAFFSQSADTVAKTAAQSRHFIENLHRFLCAFEAKYRYEKRIRGILDFNDLERLACGLLTDENGHSTALADEISAQYDEIYIDEYQDVNQLQDTIFSAIGKTTDRFMVGDIKQSIYGFRGAEPTLFADYRRNDRVKKIYLRHNFRCDRPIIDFVNRICGTLFTCAGRTVPYDETDQLVCGKGGDGEHAIELAVIDTGTKKAAERRQEEANYVAERIATLVQEGAKPEEICILLRSATRSATLYEEALSKKGIPCRNRVTKDLFVNPEVLLVLNLLHVIDNPSRDIYLAGALKSPIYNLSLSELALIRRSRKDGSLYDALRQYTEQNNFAKGRYFLNKLSEYRLMASEPVDKLIWHLYRDADILALATGGKQDPSTLAMRANLLMLYDYARKFEHGGFKGLHNFIQYIHDVLDSGAGFDSAPSASENESAVRIMTIHQSKGLEFPVVFLCDCGSPFNESDKNDQVLIDRHFGATLKLSDETGLATIDTVFRQAEALGIAAKNYDEEIRVLYVALTRAIHRLIVTGAVSKPNQLLTECRLLSAMATPETGYLFHRTSGFLPWLLIAAGDAYTPILVPAIENQEGTVAIPVQPMQDPLNEVQIASFKEEFRRRFDFVYPREVASSLPAKLSVSELYPSILDDYEDAAKLSDTRKKRMRLPKFRMSTRDSAANRGTATHQFMQFCDFSRLATGDVEGEIKRLVQKRFLDTHTASLIDRGMLIGFLSSSLYPLLRDASDFRRELRFSVRLPAATFTDEPKTKELLREEWILVQGIMDGVFLDKTGRLTILDYKTDHIPKDMKENRDAFKQLLIERHRQQLSYYRAACEAMMCQTVDRILLYSFALGECIEVPLEALRLS